MLLYVALHFFYTFDLNQLFELTSIIYDFGAAVATGVVTL